jgi:hypothetical protein
VIDGAASGWYRVGDDPSSVRRKGVPVDGSRFDNLARSLAQSGSRRRLVAGLLGGALGLVGFDRAGAVACRTPGQLCRENANC